MAYTSRVLRQLAQPSGLLGRLILNRLNAVNQGMNAVTLQALDLDKNDAVLEIGFGGGALIGEILKAGSFRSVTGIEISDLAINRGKKIFSKQLNARILDLRSCSDHGIPFGDSTFTKASCVNVIYFWSDVAAMLTEVNRVLSDGGLFVLTYSEESPDRVATFLPKHVESELMKAGFDTSDTVTNSDKENGNYHCTSAHK